MFQGLDARVPATRGRTKSTLPAGLGPLPFAGPESAVPKGWLLCDGRTVSRTTYAALFAVIGTLYGSGDGVATFTLPDLRGRGVFGKDNMGGSAASRITSTTFSPDGQTIGAVGGAQTVTQTTNELVSHPHPATGGSFFTSNNTSAFPAGGCGSAGSLTANTGNAGSGNPLNKMNPGIITNFIIKA